MTKMFTSQIPPDNPSVIFIIFKYVAFYLEVTPKVQHNKSPLMMILLSFSNMKDIKWKC